MKRVFLRIANALDWPRIFRQKTVVRSPRFSFTGLSLLLLGTAHLHAAEPLAFYVNYAASVPTAPLVAHPLAIVHPDANVDLVAGSRCFAPHFHLPLQHASDRMLAAMRRPYTIAYYSGLVDEIRRRHRGRLFGAAGSSSACRRGVARTARWRSL